MTGTTGTELAQALDVALAAYARHYGRPQALERLRFMLARSEEAQRVLDEGSGRGGGEIVDLRKAAE